MNFYKVWFPTLCAQPFHTAAYGLSMLRKAEANAGGKFARILIKILNSSNIVPKFLKSDGIKNSTTSTIDDDVYNGKSCINVTDHIDAVYDGSVIYYFLSKFNSWEQVQFSAYMANITDDADSVWNTNMMLSWFKNIVLNYDYDGNKFTKNSKIIQKLDNTIVDVSDILSIDPPIKFSVTENTHIEHARVTSQYNDWLSKYDAMCCNMENEKNNQLLVKWVKQKKNNQLLVKWVKQKKQKNNVL